MVEGTKDEREASSDGRDDPFSADELRAIAREISRDFSAGSVETAVRLFEIDPKRAHAFWSISPADAQAADVDGRGRTLVLRFVDMTPSTRGPAHPAFDVAVEGRSNNWYVDLWADGRSYVVDLGVRAADGGFRSLARSNQIDLPPAGPSRDSSFRRLDAVAPEPPAATVPVVGASEDAELFRSLFPKREDPREFPDVSLARMVSAVAPLEPAPRPLAVGPEVERPFPARDAIPPAPVSPGPAIAPSDRLVVPSDRPALGAAASAGAPVGAVAPTFPAVTAETIRAFSAAAVEAENRALRSVTPAGRDGATAAASPAGGTSPITAAAPIESSTGSPSLESSTGSPSGEADPAAAIPAPPAPVAALPLESVAALSSFVNGAGVDFEINAELVIFGRARPGSALSLYGRPVSLAEDGTFAIRRPLPQGALVLPLLLGAGAVDNRGGEG